VGGAILDAVLGLSNLFARSRSAMISQQPRDTGARSRQHPQHHRQPGVDAGFIISDHLNRYPEFIAEVGGWLKAADEYQETVIEGSTGGHAFLLLRRQHPRQDDRPAARG
jgi:NADPH-dependent curcumin reductase CurA